MDHERISSFVFGCLHIICLHACLLASGIPCLFLLIHHTQYLSFIDSSRYRIAWKDDWHRPGRDGESPSSSLPYQKRPWWCDDDHNDRQKTPGMPRKRQWN